MRSRAMRGDVTEIGKRSATVKLEVILDGVSVEVPTLESDRRTLLNSLFRQFQEGPGHEFMVKYNGTVICSSNKAYTPRTDCNSLIFRWFY